MDLHLARVPDVREVSAVCRDESIWIEATMMDGQRIQVSVTPKGARFAPRGAVNLGIGGDRTQHVLWRLENGNIEGLKPKAAMLMIGTNNSNGKDHTAEEIADGIKAIVAKLRKELPETKILLLAIFPRGELCELLWPDDDPSRTGHRLSVLLSIVRGVLDPDRVFANDYTRRVLGP